MFIHYQYKVTTLTQKGMNILCLTTNYIAKNSTLEDLDSVKI